MFNIERGQSGSRTDVVEVLALFLSGKIKKGDLSKNDQFSLGYYLGLMSDDPGFARQVILRKEQLSIASGQRTSLFSPEDLKNAKKHRKKREGVGLYLQPRLWEDSTPEKVITGGMIDPEQNIVGMHKKHSELIVDDVRMTKGELRNRIGLPIARGKSPHVNDDFYKYLVRRVCTFDIFGIFAEYDRSIGEVPKELDDKINLVGELVDGLLNKGLNRPERYHRFHEFIDEHREEWTIPAHAIPSRFMWG